LNKPSNWFGMSAPIKTRSGGDRTDGGKEGHVERAELLYKYFPKLGDVVKQSTPVAYHDRLIVVAALAAAALGGVMTGELPHCRSGPDVWFDRSDTNRCCEPDDRRELRLACTYGRRPWVQMPTDREGLPTGWRGLLNG
jgi:hypothetical protein